MRIRQVKPSFWGDAKLAALPERTRLFYIGLWMLADDAGWLRWDAVEAARDLYGFDGRKAREARVATMFGELVDAGRVVLQGCGHAFVPTLRDHQRFAAAEKQVRTFEREHAACVVRAAGDREDPRVPAEARNGTERNGIGQEKVGEGAGGATGALDGAARGGSPKSFRDIVGDPAQIIGPKR